VTLSNRTCAELPDAVFPRFLLDVAESKSMSIKSMVPMGLASVVEYVLCFLVDGVEGLIFTVVSRRATVDMA
jgi:hypothetical protein